VDPFEPVEGVVVGPDGVAGRLFQNSRYQVILREHPTGPFGPYVHLTSRNRDGSTRHDWRDFQRIKNELVGEEAEGVELYPAESRLVDTINHYHLWVFPEHRFPFGMTGSGSQRRLRRSHRYRDAGIRPVLGGLHPRRPLC
jgi:hypothetical protein